jgi:hypothetical protein
VCAKTSINNQVILYFTVKTHPPWDVGGDEHRTQTLEWKGHGEGTASLNLENDFSSEKCRISKVPHILLHPIFKFNCNLNLVFFPGPTHPSLQLFIYPFNKRDWI